MGGARATIGAAVSLIAPCEQRSLSLGGNCGSGRRHLVGGCFLAGPRDEESIRQLGSPRHVPVALCAWLSGARTIEGNPLSS